LSWRKILFAGNRNLRQGWTEKTNGSILEKRGGAIIYQKILAPIDGSEGSLEALKEALQLAESLGASAHLTVLHVTPPVTINEASLGIDLEELKRDQNQIISTVLDSLFKGRRVSHEVQFLDGDPAQVICQKAKDEQYELIVVGNRGHGLFVELLIGSVSAKVVHHAPCPVLVVRR